MKKSLKDLTDFLEPIRNRNYALFPVDALLTDREIKELIRLAEKRISKKDNQIKFICNRLGQGLVKSKQEKVGKLIESKITRALMAVNSGEVFLFEALSLRMAKNAVPIVSRRHVDDTAYFVVVLALDSVGPVLYVKTADRKEKKIVVPEGHGVVMSGVERERVRSIEAISHLAPKKKFKKRTVLIATYRDARIFI